MVQHKHVNVPDFSNGKQICSMLVVLLLLNKIYSHFKENDVKDYKTISSMFSKLCLQVSNSQQPPTCPDLDFVLSRIPDDHRKNIAEALKELVNSIVSLNGWKTPEWLYAVPLIHILNGKIEPFQRPTLTSKDINWKNDCIDVTLESSNSSRLVVVKLVLRIFYK